MNADLAPALVAAGGGSLLVGGIWLHEQRRDAAMRSGRVRLALRFPVGVEPVQALAALDSLSGLPHTVELVAEVAAGEGFIQHALWVPGLVRESVRSLTTAAVPGLRLSEAHGVPERPVMLALRLSVPPRSVLSAENAAASSRALLAGLAILRAGERVLIRWALRPGSARTEHGETDAGLGGREMERAWQRKLALPGFQVSGLVLIGAAGLSRARELARHIESVLRSRRGVAGGVWIAATRGRHRAGAQPRVARRSGWLSTPELLALLAWPLGANVPAGVEVGAARELLAGRRVPREGRRLLVGRDVAGERPVALSAGAATHHLAVLGPTGSGKSVVLARGVLDDLTRGHGGVLIDPKADLLGMVLDRVPAADADRVVVLDPAAPGPVPGLDLFGSGEAELRSDVILSVLRSLSDSWGPRIDQYLRLGLRTVAELPNPVLSDWLGLYSDPALRRSVIARLDPIRRADWAAYEALSPAAQHEFIAPALSRITSLLSRPALRAVLNQSAPKLDIARLLSERKWLLVSLAPGALGEPAARLLGAIVTYLVWTAIEARVLVSPERRRAAFLYFDELQSLSSLPIGLELFFERTRGLGCGVVVATQALGRLPESTKASLLGNTGSLLTFTAGADEAGRIARELPGLAAADIIALGRFEVAARVHTQAGAAILTGRTEPLPPSAGQAMSIRARSASHYGTDPAEVEAELARRIDGDGHPAGGLGRTGRTQ
jgi:hypothetical protein